QVGIIGHIQIANGTKIQAQSGIGGDLNVENGKHYGSPAINYTNYLRSYAEFKHLPETVKKINNLEKLVEELNKKL
ncbi:MAG: UDP-3-O-(3-hydroxymyristoyl)glucosamine N-acyltransferase, partial [Saprospiraceae bacterium]